MKAAFICAVLALIVPVRASTAQSVSTSTATATPALSGSMAAQAEQSMARFGEAVAVSQEWAFVGEPDPRLFTQNALFVFRLTGGEWVPVDTLTTSEAGDSFGSALDIHANRLFVGAPTAAGTGAVYVYELDASGDGWTQTHQLQVSAHVDGARFGSALDANGDLLVVGAPYQNHQNGAAYVFERQEDESWVQVDALADTRDDGGLFGFAVAAMDSRIAVGAQYSDERAGVVYSFARDESTGTYTLDQELIGSEVQAGHRFGRSLAAAGDTLYIGSPFYLGNVGLVYAFAFDSQDEAWTESAVIGHDAPLRFYFGWSVAAGGDLLVAGGLESFRGHIYAREAPGGAYALEAMPGESEALGVWSVAAVDGHVLIGSRGMESAMLYSETESGWEMQTTVRGGTYSLSRIEGTIECSGGSAAGFPCERVDLLSFLPIHELGTVGTARLNDIWGWTDPVTGTEYALVGRTDGTSFVDLSDPEQPVLIGSLPTATYASGWRDIKVINDHAVIVADNAGEHGMQIFDLAQLRSVTDAPVTFEPTAVYDRIGSAHNVVTNAAADQAYIVGVTGEQTVPAGFSCGPGPHIVDMSDPANPTFAGCFNPSHGRGYTHDAQCLRYDGPDEEHAGKHLCFGADEVGISVTDVTDPEQPEELSLASYLNKSYTHQGWLTADGRYFIVNDETDETNGLASRTRTMVFDVEDLDDPIFVGDYLGETTASDHNLYVHGQYVYEANYRAGLRILDLGSGDLTTGTLQEVGYFDVYPLNDDPGFNGSWSSYPYFASGIVVVSGMESGLFVLSPRLESGVAREETPERLRETRLRSFPNPSYGPATVALTLEQGANVRVELFDALGRSVRLLHDGFLSAGTQSLPLEAAGLPAGTYFIRAVGEGVSETETVTIRP